MIPAALPRHVAALLLRFAIWIAPHDALDWGHGMLSELNHVEGSWSSLVWAIGGTGVLAKHAILAVILPGSHRPIVSSASELLDKEGPMRKTTLSAIAACTMASLLFFLAPVFRQAFRVSLAQWDDVLHTRSTFGYPKADPDLDALAKSAEQTHDPELLAFVATREPRQSESVRLADEAVRLDRNLTWLYAIVAVHWSSFPELERWVPALEKFDPQNGLPYLITAEKIDIDQVERRQIPQHVEEEPAAWKEAMSAVFRSQKLETYSTEQKELDHRVLLRHAISDPFEAMNNGWYRLPSFGISDSSRYAELLIESADSLEARGDHEGAAEKYFAVARFGQRLAPTDSFFLRREIKEAYKQLGALSERNGNKIDAALYALLSNQLDRDAEKELASWRSNFRGSAVSRWNALLVRLSGLVLLVCAALLLLSVAGVMVRRRSLRLASLRPSRLTLTLGFGAALGSLLASAVLFVCYRPYSEVLYRFINNSDESGMSELSNFLGDAQVPLGTRDYLGVSDAVFYFWFFVAVLCALALLVSVLRHVQTRPRPAAARTPGG